MDGIAGRHNKEHQRSSTLKVLYSVDPATPTFKSENGIVQRLSRCIAFASKLALSYSAN